MKKFLKKKVNIQKKEKGAAMVMVLLMSFLLMIVSAGLLLEVTMNTANVTDATAEQQAYNAAESGIQATLNVLRGHTNPSPLIDDTKPANDPANMIDFKKAINLATSNKTGETSTVPRLSRWLNYNHTPDSSLIADRIILGKDTYNPLTDNAYKVLIEDPDNTGSKISYTTVGNIDGSGSSMDVFSGLSKLTIKYNSANVSNLDVSSGSAVTNFGELQLISNGIVTIIDDIRFSIEVNMTTPYNATRVIRGYIKAGTVSAGSVGSVTIDFDSKAYVLMGSKFILDNDPLTPEKPNVNSGKTMISGTITPAEPIRLLVKSTGFGPRGATKELEAVVQKNFFNGMSAPATLTLVGRESGFVFNPGSSAATEYSGDDVASDLQIPPIGTTNDTNLDIVTDSVDGLPPHPYNGGVVGTPSNITAELPTWLETPANLDATIQALRNVSKSSGRYFSSGQPIVGGFGDFANARGITFVDGDTEFGGGSEGGGIMIVTGKLTLKGNFKFKGLIVVTGAAGIDRSGGGGGVLQGNTVVAPYNPNNLALDFLGPKYNLSGGGNSGIEYNSSSVANGLTAVSNFVLGVAEK